MTPTLYIAIGYCLAKAERALRKWLTRPRAASNPFQSYLEDQNK